MSSKVNNIGTFTFKTFNAKTLERGTYTENVVIDENFDYAELFKIVKEDQSLVKFEIFNPVTGELLLTTDKNVLSVTFDNGTENGETVVATVTEKADKNFLITTVPFGSEYDVARADLINRNYFKHNLEFTRVIRDEEILGITYNMGKYTYKKKVTWKVNNWEFKTKKQAVEMAQAVNDKAINKIKALVK